MTKKIGSAAQVAGRLCLYSRVPYEQNKTAQLQDVRNQTCKGRATSTRSLHQPHFNMTRVTILATQIPAKAVVPGEWLWATATSLPRKPLPMPS